MKIEIDYMDPFTNEITKEVFEAYILDEEEDVTYIEFTGHYGEPIIRNLLNIKVIDNEA